jgi:hypothetical protein
MVVTAEACCRTAGPVWLLARAAVRGTVVRGAVVRAAVERGMARAGSANAARVNTAITTLSMLPMISRRPEAAADGLPERSPFAVLRKNRCITDRSSTVELPQEMVHSPGRVPHVPYASGFELPLASFTPRTPDWFRHK